MPIFQMEKETQRGAVTFFKVTENVNGRVGFEFGGMTLKPCISAIVFGSLTGRCDSVDHSSSLKLPSLA
jgi:hypothetical protein